MPSQKVGTPSASALQPLSRRSSQEFGFTALAIATGMPMTNATKIAASANCNVAGKRSPISCSTGWRLWSESPKSPVSARPSQSAYCTTIGRSSP